MRRGVAVVLGAFALAQLAVVLAAGNGPFVDEGIYATAGARFLQGFEESYAWLGGSVWLYPVVSGGAFLVGGIVASRVVTVLLYCVALLLFERFARSLVGPRAATWAVALLAINGVFFSIAHLAVYDALAFVGWCGALSALARGASTPSVRVGLELAGFLALGVLSKFFVAVAFAFAFPLAWALWPRARVKLLWLSVGGAVVVFLAALRVSEGVWLPLEAFAAVATQDVVSPEDVVVRALWFGGVAWGLGAVGFAGCVVRSPGLACALVSGALAWPLLHVVVGSHVSLYKHVAYGFVCVYPLAGKALAEWWQSRRAVAAPLLLIAATVGAAQAFVQDHAWADVRPLARFLRKRVAPTDRVAFEWSWSLALYLAARGPLASPTQLRDHFGAALDPNCECTWVITTQGPGLPLDAYARAARRCGLTPVARFPGRVWYPAPPFARIGEWDFVVYGQRAQ